MQEYLTNLFDESSFSLWSAFLLGLITSLGPCTLTTNITAISFISKNYESGSRVLIGGLIYTLGRAFSYFAVALILFLGADMLKISSLFARFGEKIIGPILILIGLVMLDIIPIRFPSFSKLSKKIEKKRKTYIQDFLLGVVFALAFCSYSGVMYFGLLIPMTINNPLGLILPLLFALGTGIMVIFFSILVAFAFSGVNKWFLHISNFEIWLRRIIAIVFIILGISKLIPFLV